MCSRLTSSLEAYDTQIQFALLGLLADKTISSAVPQRCAAFLLPDTGLNMTLMEHGKDTLPLHRFSAVIHKKRPH